MDVEKGHKLLEVDSLINSARILVHGKWEGKKIGSEQNKSQQLLAPGAYIRGRQWLLANSRRPLQMTLRG